MRSPTHFPGEGVKDLLHFPEESITLENISENTNQVVQYIRSKRDEDIGNQLVSRPLTTNE